MSSGRPTRGPSQPGAGTPHALDVVEILASLIREQVSFLVVGGIAVGHHGYVRATKDVDIVPEPTADNLARLWRALVALEARPLAVGDFRPEEVVPLTLESLELGGNWDLETRSGRLDILQYIAGVLETSEDCRRLLANADRHAYPFGDVAFIGYEDLIDFKEVAGRGLDLVDIRALREARGETSPER